MLRSKNEVDKHVKELFSKFSFDNVKRKMKGYNIAELYFKIKEYESSKRYLEEFLTVRPKCHRGHKLMGQINEQLNERRKAIQSYKMSYGLESQTQADLVLKICELLYNEVDNEDVSAILYWIDLGEKHFPNHETIAHLRNKITSKNGTSKEELETLYLDEIRNNPLTLNFHLILLKLYMEWNVEKLKDAYRYTVRVEEKSPFPYSYDWYSNVLLVVEECQKKGLYMSDESFQEFYLIILDRCLNALLFDPILYSPSTSLKALSLLSKFDSKIKMTNAERLNPSFMNHMICQLYFYYACLLDTSQKQKKDLNNVSLMWSVLLFHSLNDAETTYIEKEFSGIRKMCSWHRKIRISIASHLINQMCDEAQSKLKYIKEVKELAGSNVVRQNIYNLVFNNSSEICTEPGYFLYSKTFPNSLFIKPSQDFLFYLDIEVLSYCHDNLTLILWIVLHYPVKKREDSYSRGDLLWKCTFFPNLPIYGSWNIENLQPETICQLDLMAFIEATLYCYNLNFAEEYKSARSNLPFMCPNIVNSEQKKFWGAVGCLCFKKSRDKLNSLRNLVQKNLAIIRSKGPSHISSVHLVANFARLFALTAEEVNGDDDLKEALEERAEYYWRNVVNHCEKYNRISTPVPEVKLFNTKRSVLQEGDIIDLKAEATLFIAERLAGKGKRTEAIQILSSLKQPEALFKKAIILKDSAEEILCGKMTPYPDKLVAEYKKLLNESRDCLLAFDKIRVSNLACVKLQEEVPIHLDYVEAALQSVNEEESFYDAPLENSYLSTNGQKYKAAFSTPAKISTPRPFRYEASPEKMDAHFKQLKEMNEKTLRAIEDHNAQIKCQNETLISVWQKSQECKDSITLCRTVLQDMIAPTHRELTSMMQLITDIKIEVRSISAELSDVRSKVAESAKPDPAPPILNAYPSAAAFSQYNFIPGHTSAPVINPAAYGAFGNVSPFLQQGSLHHRGFLPLPADPAQQAAMFYPNEIKSPSVVFGSNSTPAAGTPKMSFGKPANPATTPILGISPMGGISTSKPTTPSFTFSGSNVNNSLSFADMAEKCGSMFKITDEKVFQSNKLFGLHPPVNTSQHDDDDDAIEEYEPDAQFKPAIDLPDEVAVVTGEENEEKIFGERAKLFRFDAESKEWKERGVGVLKLLKNKDSGRYRIVMRREQTQKMCANHFITADITINLMETSEKALLWNANDFADEEIKLEKLCARFKTAVEANDFKDAFENAKQSMEKGEATDGNEKVDQQKFAPAINIPKASPSIKLPAVSPSPNFSSDFGTVKSSPAPTSTSVPSIFSGSSIFNTSSSNFEAPRSIFDAKPVTTTGTSAPSILSGSSIFVTSSSNSKVPSSIFDTKPVTTSSSSIFGNISTPILGGISTPILGGSSQFSAVTSVTTTTTSTSSIFGGFSVDSIKSNSIGFNFGFKNNDSSGASFADMAKSSSDSLFKISDSNAFISRPIFGNQSKVDDSQNDSDAEEEYEPDVKFKPVIALPDEVAVVTGEENEEKKFEGRLKLFRFDAESKEWKERGVGVLKLLKNKASGQCRIVMRRDQTQKMCANHFITADMTIDFMQNSQKALLWNASDFADEEIKHEKLCAKFKAADEANAFKTAFENAQHCVQEGEQTANDKSIKKEEDDDNEKDASVMNIPQPSSSINLSEVSPSPTLSSVFGQVKSSPAPTSPSAPSIFSGPSIFNTSSSNFQAPSSIFDAKPVTTTSISAPSIFGGSSIFSTSSFNSHAHSSIFGTIPVMTSSNLSNSIFGSISSAPILGGSSQFGAVTSVTTTTTTSTSSSIFGGFSVDSIKSNGLGFNFGIKNNDSSGASFADMAKSSSDSLFKISDSKAFISRPIFGNQSKVDDSQNHSDAEEEYEPDVKFKPVIALPDEIAIVTGEENEEKKFEERSKLFRFDAESKEWKERGVGVLKLLKNNASDQYRIVMRRDQTQKMCANHFITADMTIDFIQNSQKALLWNASDFADEEIKHEKLCARFKSADEANAFKTAFENAQQCIQEGEQTANDESIKKEENDNEKDASEINISKPSSSINLSEASATPTINSIFGQVKSSVASTSTSASSIFSGSSIFNTSSSNSQAPSSIFGTKPVTSVNSSSSIFGNISTTPIFGGTSQISGVTSVTTTTTTTSTSSSIFGGFSVDSIKSSGIGFNFGIKNNDSSGASFADIAKSSSDSLFKISDSNAFISRPIFGNQSKVDDSQNDSDAEEEYVPEVKFKPVIDLPDEVAVVTGEENEEKEFEERAKLFRFDTESKEWKERGVGVLKLLKNKASGQYRIVMRRDQTQKMCANHLITADMTIDFMQNTHKALLWNASDFADEEIKHEKLCARFKSADEANAFKTAFENGQQCVQDGEQTAVDKSCKKDENDDKEKLASAINIPKPSPSINLSEVTSSQTVKSSPAPISTSAPSIFSGSSIFSTSSSNTQAPSSIFGTKPIMTFANSSTSVFGSSSSTPIFGGSSQLSAVSSVASTTTTTSSSSIFGGFSIDSIKSNGIGFNFGVKNNDSSGSSFADMGKSSSDFKISDSNTFKSRPIFGNQPNIDESQNELDVKFKSDTTVSTPSSKSTIFSGATFSFGAKDITSNQSANSPFPFNSKSIFGGTTNGSSFGSNRVDEDISILYEAKPTREQIYKAKKLQLPESFYLYEDAPPCPGCRGCEANEYAGDSVTDQYYDDDGEYAYEDEDDYEDEEDYIEDEEEYEGEYEEGE